MRRSTISVEKLAAYVIREGGLSADDAVGWVVRLTSTLEPIHGLGVSHGRVSAKAIHIAAPHCASPGFLLDAGDLADDPAYFSLSRVMIGRRSPSDDCWAAGVTLYRMLSGKLPFAGSTIEEMRRLLEGPRPAPLAVFDVGDDGLQGVLDRVFARDESQRITRLSEFREALIQARPMLAQLPPLRYGRPDDEEEEDDDGGGTTSVFNFDEDASNEMVREAKRRLVGASALRDMDSAPRSVKPPRRPTPAPMPASGLDVIESAIPAPVRRLPDSEPPTRLRRAAVPMPLPAPEPLPQIARPEPASTPEAPKPLPRAVARPEPASTPELPKPLPREVARPEPAPAPAFPEHALAPETAPPARTSVPAVEPPAAPPPPAEVAIDHHSSSAQAHVASIDPPRASRRATPLRLGLGAVCVLVGAAAAYFVFSDQSTAPTQHDTAPQAHDSGAPPEPSTPAAPVASATTSASASAAVEAPSAPEGEPDEVAQCVMELMPPDTFAQAPDVDKLCGTANPIEGSAQLQKMVAQAGGGDRGTTAGMTEVSTMGWYRLAAFSIIQTQCCKAPPTITTPTNVPCNLDDRLGKLGREVSGGGDLASEAALEKVTQSFYCLARAGSADFFGQAGMPNGGELTTFLKLFARARKRAVRTGQR